MQTLYELEPCGVIPVHTHPGGTESIFVFEGRIEAGFVGVMRVLQTEVKAKEAFQVPQGALFT